MNDCLSGSLISDVFVILSNDLTSFFVFLSTSNFAWIFDMNLHTLKRFQLPSLIFHWYISNLSRCKQNVKQKVMQKLFSNMQTLEHQRKFQINIKFFQWKSLTRAQNYAQRRKFYESTIFTDGVIRLEMKSHQSFDMFVGVKMKILPQIKLRIRGFWTSEIDFWAVFQLNF